MNSDSVLQVTHKVFKKYNLPEEIYRKIFKYIPLHTVVTEFDSRLLLLFFPIKSIICNLLTLKQCTISCNTCNFLCKPYVTLNICHECSKDFCDECVKRTGCCGAALCSSCIILCNSEEYNGYYCHQCLVDEYNTRENNDTNFAMHFGDAFDGY
jgi:hypothetical protein